MFSNFFPLVANVAKGLVFSLFGLVAPPSVPLWIFAEINSSMILDGAPALGRDKEEGCLA
jgi:hypothetical protein